MPRVFGAVQRLPNGNTLIAESVAGRALEVTREGEVVWEFVNPRRGGKEGQLIAMLPQADRIAREDVADWLDIAVLSAVHGTEGPRTAADSGG